MWEIADFAQAYSSQLITPLQVAKSIMSHLKGLEQQAPEMKIFISQQELDLLTRAQSSTMRYLSAVTIFFLLNRRIFLLGTISYGGWAS